VVRGPAAVLTLAAAALGAALLWLAPVLPQIGDATGDAATLVAGCAGLLAVAACALVAVPAVRNRVVAWALAATAVALAVGFALAGAGTAATPAEALAYGAVGVLFATLLDTAALALVLPLFVAGVDVLGVAGGSSGGLALDRFATRADILTLGIPAWGSDASVARLGGADVLLLAAFARYARLHGLREPATGVALAAALVAALALEVAGVTGAPVLALLAAAYYGVNADRLPGLARAARAG